jgi:8-oxo-dGTP pyrophosphatase MutT (NUDIX family)
VSSFVAPDVQQEQLAEDYLAYLATHPDATARSCAPAHVTASALVLDPVRRRVVLTLHPKIGRWLQLGGHCEPQDLVLADTARREATEESGLPGLDVVGPPVRLDRHEVRCRPDGSIGVHLDVQYVVRTTTDAALLPSEESPSVRWWPLDGLPEDVDGSVRALIGAALLA